MAKIPLNSSHMKYSEYLEGENAVIIEFEDGSQYRYDHFTPELYQSFLGAPSRGKFFHHSIKTLPSRKIK